MRRLHLLLLVASLVACDDDTADNDPPAGPDSMAVDPDVGTDAVPDVETGDDPDADTRDPDAAVPDVGADAAPPNPDATVEPLDLPCNTAVGEIPEGLVELKHDDGAGMADLIDQDWEIAGVPVATGHLWEAVKFELEHPARIHAITVQYGQLPQRDDWPVELGVFPDFGYNGFDFWKFDAQWSGSRCSGDLKRGEWVTFVLDEPVEIDHPGLVYVGSLRDHPRDQAILFDGNFDERCAENPQECCNGFDRCHSAWNFPELRNVNGTPFWPGLSTSFLYDYMVRIHVEYTEEADPAEDLFQPVPDLATSNRMAWGDYDNDGDDDMLLPGPRLMRNDDGAFVDVSEETGLSASGAAGAGVWGDYDNDGCLDILAFVESPHRADSLLRNDCEGGFTNVTEASGIVDLQEYLRCEGDETATGSPTPAAAWWDYDGDGLLDIYLPNFICWPEGTYYTDTIWHNDGDGRFSDRTGMDGFRDLDAERLASRGAAPIDVDQDGDVDILVNNYRLHRNIFYLSNGDGTVEQAHTELNLTGNLTQQGLSRAYGHSIGTAWGDLDGDGDYDLVVANLAHPRFFDFSDKSQVLIQQEDGTFEDIQGAFEQPWGDAGLRYQETHSVPVLGYFDHDGNLDLAISATYDGRPSDFYWGNGDGTFRLDQYRSGLDVRGGWGMAVADYDHDGDLDLATSQGLLENTGGSGGHWFQVRAVGNVASNRAALGATVRVVADGRLQVRHVNGGTGQGCQDSLYLHFGLGDAEAVERVEVLYPGGGLVTYEGPFDADQRLWVYEDGAATPGWVGEP